MGKFSTSLINFIIAKRKRNKKKTTSSTTLSNKDLEQSPSTNRKPGEEAARRDVEREAEEEREMEEEPTTGAPADDGWLFSRCLLTITHYAGAEVKEESSVMKNSFLRLNTCTMYM